MTSVKMKNVSVVGTDFRFLTLAKTKIKNGIRARKRGLLKLRFNNDPWRPHKYSARVDAKLIEFENFEILALIMHLHSVENQHF